MYINIYSRQEVLSGKDTHTQLYIINIRCMYFYQYCCKNVVSNLSMLVKNYNM